MLKNISSRQSLAKGAPFAIVASSYNTRYVDAMLNAALAELRAAGARDVFVVRVPGAYEVPVVAKRLARVRKPAAIICLGLILRGETVHADHIGEAVSRALMDIQIATEVPMIHAVLLMENELQAVKRCLGKQHNRGTEAARTALEMARVMKDL